MRAQSPHKQPGHHPRRRTSVQPRRREHRPPHEPPHQDKRGPKRDHRDDDDRPVRKTPNDRRLLLKEWQVIGGGIKKTARALLYFET